MIREFAIPVTLASLASARSIVAHANALEPFVSGYVGVNHTDTLYADIAVPDLAVREDRRELCARRQYSGALRGRGWTIPAALGVTYRF